jgi:hypothetical protein
MASPRDEYFATFTPAQCALWGPRSDHEEDLAYSIEEVMSEVERLSDRFKVKRPIRCRLVLKGPSRGRRSVDIDPLSLEKVRAAGIDMWKVEWIDLWRECGDGLKSEIPSWRDVAIYDIRSMIPLLDSTVGQAGWLRDQAGWSSMDIEYYNWTCAVPRGRGVVEWALLSPESYESFRTTWQESKEKGVDVHELLVRDRGAEEWQRAVKDDASRDDFRPEDPQFQALREMAQEKTRVVADLLAAGDLRLAHEVLVGITHYSDLRTTR